MNIAIIGCGVIGHKMVEQINWNNHELVAAIDTDTRQANHLAQLYNKKINREDDDSNVSIQTSTELLNDPEFGMYVDAAIVATSHDSLARITRQCMRLGIHVLVEKPSGKSSAEIQKLINYNDKVIVQTGFNHRYHPALLKAKELVDDGMIGKIMFVRGRYGHGGRLGYDKEWRANPSLAGGGETLEQGVHLIDLARLYLGDITEVQGEAFTYYWDMPMDDNGFIFLKNKDSATAWLSVSCTEWRNLFSFEIFGTQGKLVVDGLGGAYGLETLTHHWVKLQMGYPETTKWEFPEPDRSFGYEFEIFTQAINTKTPIGPTLQDAKAAYEVVEKIYDRSTLC